MDREKIKAICKKWLWNRYVLTCLIAAVVLVCCGEQSLIHRIQRNQQISKMEEELTKYQERIDYYNKSIQHLEESPENRERFAREEYRMHADNEDVYLIEEDE